jgi:pimeloyl-ACP methyl ester carboxylesterase
VSSGQLAPHAAQRVIVDVASGPLATLQAGRDEDPGVLLVPGYTGSKEDFVPIVDTLVAAGLRVTCVDLPGQYESPGPDDPARYTPDALAVWLLELADALGGVRHLLGHSFGGLVARAAVIAEPHRFGDLVLMSSGPASIEGLRRVRIDQLAPLMPGGLTAVWSAMQLALASEPGYVAPPADLGAFLELRFLAGRPAMVQGMGDAIRAEPDRVDALRDTGIRTLVLHGADDDAWPPEVQKEMAERLRADYAVIPDAAHSPAAENPDATARALLEFWRAS